MLPTDQPSPAPPEGAPAIPDGGILRFSNTAILLKQPLLVSLTLLFVLGLLATHYDPEGTSDGGIGPWIGLALLLIVCTLAAWLLGSSQSVEIDPARKRVTQRHLFFKQKTAQNDWSFSQFTGVRVERVTGKSDEATTTPGSGWQKTGTRTVYSHHYTISLLRADTEVVLPDRKMQVPHHPLELPMDKQDNPLPLEAIARRLGKLGGWPAMRRGYALMAGDTPGEARGAHAVKGMPLDAESAIDADGAA